VCQVLLIEDDWLIADHVAHVLVGAGASAVAHAAGQAQAVAMAIEDPPAFIVSDVQLLEGTGPLAVQAIIGALGPMPVIFITGTPEDCYPRDAGAVVLGKPVDDACLGRTFRSLAPAARL
jgi:two-component system, response regulator PdtaR